MEEVNCKLNTIFTRVAGKLKVKLKV